MKQEELRIPLLGKIAAGTPLLASENGEESLSLPCGFLRSGDYFALKVSGDSMKDAGINSGDIAVVRRQNAVDNGDVAAVVIEDEATLKHFFQFSDRMVLKSANPLFPDLVYSRSAYKQIHLAGKLACLLKRMD